jgi:hypothetical protein
VGLLVRKALKVIKVTRENVETLARKVTPEIKALREFKAQEVSKATKVTKVIRVSAD